MEIIIGREEGMRRLHCIADGREFNIGQAGAVPTTVSRQHCKLTIEGEKLTIENLKAQNITYVDGNQIFSKSITINSNVQLGNEKFPLPLKSIVALVQAPGQKKPQESAPEFSLLPLKRIWEEYDNRKLQIQEDAQKKANQQRIQGIVSMCAMLLGAIPQLGAFRFILMALALAMAVYFFVRSKNDTSVTRQIHDLDEEFAKKYKCPNPKCGRPFGSIPYRNIEFTKGCPACNCKYNNR